MTKFDPELVQVMRAVLEEIMQRVPVEYSMIVGAMLMICVIVVLHLAQAGGSGSGVC